MDLYDFCAVIGDEEAAREFLRSNGLLRSDPPGKIYKLTARSYLLVKIGDSFRMPEPVVSTSADHNDVGQVPCRQANSIRLEMSTMSQKSWRTYWQFLPRRQLALEQVCGTASFLVDEHFYQSNCGLNTTARKNSDLLAQTVSHYVQLVAGKKSPSDWRSHRWKASCGRDGRISSRKEKI